MSPTLTIHRDEDQGNFNNPRQWDNLGLMICWHRQYILGDEQPAEPPDEWLGTQLPFFVRLPLYLYDHSGITISIRPFSCPWDSGQVGWIVATVEDVKRAFDVRSLNGAIKDKVRKILEQEVRVYDQYLRGACWGYTYDTDSCWGYLGDTLEDTGLLEQLQTEHGLEPAVIETAWENRR